VRASPGFTLLETLVALVILGLGLLLAAGGIRFGLAAVERLEAIERRLGGAAAAERVLRGLLERARPEPGRTRDDPIAFAADASGLTFVAVANPADGDAVSTLFRLETAGDPLRLLACPGLRPGRLDCEGGWAERLRLRGLWRIAYLNGDRWQGEWTDDRRLPRAVRLEAAGGGTPILVALALAER
jgi:prepilin-type N-terminal cleavage/methylation domain-containing protein